MAIGAAAIGAAARGYRGCGQGLGAAARDRGCS